MSMKVVLPTPDCPEIPIIWPDFIFKFTFSKMFDLNCYTQMKHFKFDIIELLKNRSFNLPKLSTTFLFARINKPYSSNK